MNDRNKESIVDTLFDVGEEWASHGLRIAESALHASAHTLDSLSKVLGSLAAQLKREDEQVIDVQS